MNVSELKNYYFVSNIVVSENAKVTVKSVVFVDDKSMYKLWEKMDYVLFTKDVKYINFTNAFFKLFILEYAEIRLKNY